MKQFFKFMFASMLGFFLTFLIVSFLLLGLIASISSFAEKEVTTVKENSLLHLTFNKPIYDRTPNNPFENFDFQKMESSNTAGLNDILDNLKKAATDNNIKGIYLDLSQIPAGISTIEEIRNAMLKFKKSGKFIISYAEYYSTTAYYLSTVADEIILNPDGDISFKGLNAELMFLKGTLEKLDIEPQIFKVGKFKSAIEPLILEKMSEANRKQMQVLLNSIWGKIIEAISESRGISIYDLNLIADNLDITEAEQALEHNFIDKIMYKDEVLAELRTKLGIGEDDKINSLSITKYTNAPATKDVKKRSRNKVAVVYATGSIGGGEGSERVIGSEKISKTLRKARLDNNIKAVVFRVNSPGGSAIASEVIRREVELTCKVKPVIVSMGNLAASGGYWISCSADKIFADPTTITGSIGVFGFIPNLKDFYKNKLGITHDNVQTNENSDYMTTNRPLTTYQKKIIQKNVDKVYQEFLELVAEGRNMTTEQVNKIGQGRVWSGVDALRIGLIDELGGIEDAIAAAVEMAELPDYRIIELPEQKDPFEQIIKEIFSNTKVSLIKNELGQHYQYYRYIKEISDMEGVQARLPFVFEIN
ncbi:MAG: signal peptide peptidase SppA [Bacteroidales bacterium]|nr:signal peptide peptidase SppA [Bacteroidales bacterium]